MARPRKELLSLRKVVLNGKVAEVGRGARNLWVGIRMRKVGGALSGPVF